MKAALGTSALPPKRLQHLKRHTLMASPGSRPVTQALARRPTGSIPNGSSDWQIRSRSANCASSLRLS